MLLYKKLLLMTFGTSLVCNTARYTHTRYCCVFDSATSSQSVSQYCTLSQPLTTGIAGRFVCLKNNDSDNTQRLVCADNNVTHAHTELLAIQMAETYSTE